MAKRKRGSVLRYGDRWRAFVGRHYLGAADTERSGWALVEAWFQTAADARTWTLRREQMAAHGIGVAP